MLEATLFMKAFRTRSDADINAYDKENRWGISARIEGSSKDDGTVTYFKWEKEDLRTIFKHKVFGRNIMNALYGLWLPFTKEYLHNCSTQISLLGLNDSFEDRKHESPPASLRSSPRQRSRSRSRSRTPPRESNEISAPEIPSDESNGERR